MHKEIIENIRSGKREALVNLYKQYRVDFIKWAIKNFYCSPQEAEDAYQDTTIAFYENIMKNKVQELSCSPKTYLFAIGKNILLSLAKKKSNQTADIEHIKDVEDDELIAFEKIALSEQQSNILAAIKALGEPCQTILKLYYYDRLSIRKIVEKLGYKSENVVKVQKNRCMKRLKSGIEETGLKEDLR
ncbi:RNA polymerase sigma factor [Microscilla marina]|uniref:RNA polymerase sigma-70 factor, ECF subfamily, putative n=1 Tax=Microscilla marina ATCC 23134 TaxID=313606 RepID=A1ZYU6_MICM2|nr:sigma-70 family RNA polymerase sigma factor [Microscilla marina]EAY24443.1 RNA polymerase sigma-70 factor, ECF subfamily, putative [Microscilla marina ATCC 23134]